MSEASSFVVMGETVSTTETTAEEMSRDEVRTTLMPVATNGNADNRKGKTKGKNFQIFYISKIYFQIFYISKIYFQIFYISIFFFK